MGVEMEKGGLQRVALLCFCFPNPFSFFIYEGCCIFFSFSLLFSFAPDPNQKLGRTR